MDFFSIVGIGLVGVILASLVRQTKPDFAILITLATSAFIFYAVLSQIRDLLDWWAEMGNEFGLINDYLAPLIKILGITYLTQFSAQACRDAGEGAIAVKLELAGKILILTLSLPILEMVLELIKNLFS